jgi:sterol desaturase/sphingolipid hydroxylase (fatty acid hydroxylase superfamily)
MGNSSRNCSDATPKTSDTNLRIRKGRRMLSEKFVDFTRYAMLPLLLIVFGAMTLLVEDTALARVFPYYYPFFLFFAVITIERVYAYSRAVSQRHMIWRDLMSTAVQTFVAGAVMGAIVVPVLHYWPHALLGRRFLFGLSNQLGPLWLQVLAVFLLSTFWQYWMHRLQHYNEFLWKLHGYHHSVTHVQISNVLVSNPFEWALRNILGGLLLGIVGFNPLAIVIARAFGIYGYLSHCGGDVKGGWLNYFFNTPEVHRWHHAAELPDDEKYGYGCNFGVDVSFWDVIFGTLYLPTDQQGRVIPPARIGHPGGYPDEPNFLKILLGARAFPSLMRLLGRKACPSSVPAE